MGKRKIQVVPEEKGHEVRKQDKMSGEKKEMREEAVFTFYPAGKAPSGLPILHQATLCKITEPNRNREHMICVTEDNWLPQGRGRKNEKQLTCYLAPKYLMK